MFPHLHVASGYSVRYGASLPGRLVEQAAAQNLAALALTDRDTVAGAVRFARACAKAGVRPVFGVDLAVPLMHPAGAEPPKGRTPPGAAPSLPTPHRGSRCWPGTAPDGPTSVR